MMKRPRFGSIYPRGKTWWIKFYRPGNPRPIRESSHSEHYADAERLLKRRQGEIVTGKFVGPGPERVRLKELFADVIQDYRDNERDSLPDVEGRIRNHLAPAIGEVRAAEFGTQHLKRYIARRQKEEASNATANRELAIIRRAFNLAAGNDPPKVARVPKVHLLPENNVRRGFIEYEQYVTLRNELPWYLRPLFVVAYHVGGRRGELTSIRWPQVDFAANQIRLLETKNGEARTLPIYGEMREWLIIAKEIRDQKFPDCPWVFYRENGKRRLYWFYDVWREACERANVPGLLFHDLRRSAVRNMERAGVPRKVAMQISGHKTESIYRRYDIVADRDLADAAVRMERYLEATGKGQPGTIPGTITPSERQDKGDSCEETTRNLLN